MQWSDVATLPGEREAQGRDGTVQTGGKGRWDNWSRDFQGVGWNVVNSRNWWTCTCMSLACTISTPLAVLLVCPWLHYLYVLGCTTCMSLAALACLWLYYLYGLGCTSLAVLLVRPWLYYLYVLSCTTCTALAVLHVHPWLYYLYTLICTTCMSLAVLLVRP